MMKLTCLSGMNKGDVYPLKNGDIKMGRSGNNDICVLDKKSSRSHCVLHVKDDSVSVDDKKSTNGLKVNDKWVEGSSNLKIGDHLRVGQTVFLLAESTEEDNEQSNDASVSISRQRHHYENVLRRTEFVLTKTSSLRKLKIDREGKTTGYLATFTREGSVK